MKTRLLLVGTVGALLATMLQGATPAEAKAASWVISGGELGDYAFQYWPGWEDGDAIPGDAPRVAAPAVEPSLRYDVYVSWGVFAVALQFQEGRPAMAYYPGERLLREAFPSQPQAWYALRDEQAEIFDDAIAEALRTKEAGGLDPNPVVADFRAREVHKGQLSFRPSHGVGYTLNITGEAAEALALEELAAIVSRPPAGESRDTPRYSIQIWVGTRFEGWGGLFGHYSPPRQGIPGPLEGLPGRFWIESVSLNAPNPYYATTWGFDRIIAEALRSADEATRAPAPQTSDGGAIAAARNREPIGEPGVAQAEAETPAVSQRRDWRRPAALAAAIAFAAGVSAVPAARFARRRRAGPHP